MRKTYAEKLKDPQWQKRRLQIMGRDEFRCVVCYDKESTLHVHHKHYKTGRDPWEYADHELVTVCHSCHENAHEEAEKLKDACAHFEMDGPWGIQSLIALVSGFRDEHEEARGRPALLKENAGYSPEHYLAGYIAACISQPDNGSRAQFLSQLLEVFEIVKSRGSCWTLSALKQATEEGE